MLDFSDQVAVVTGGSNGIGRAVVENLGERGARVLNLDIEPGPQPWYEIDLSDAAAVRAAAARVLAEEPRVDVLVSCAGIYAANPLLAFDETAYHRLLACNLDAAVVLMSHIGRAMAAAGSGRIVNVTSVHARVAESGGLGYGVGKAGLEAATRVAALELADSGVLVNCVAPGYVATRMSVVDGVDELESPEFLDVYVARGRIPLRRAAQPGEVAAPVAWLASRENTYITGQTLVVDGGLLARF